MRLISLLPCFFLALVFTLDVNAAPKERCSDGKDNDGDGLIDAADPDCGGGETGPTLEERVTELESLVQVLSAELTATTVQAESNSLRIDSNSAVLGDHESRISVLESGAGSELSCTTNYCSMMGPAVIYNFALTSTARAYDFNTQDLTSVNFTNYSFGGSPDGQVTAFSGGDSVSFDTFSADPYAEFPILMNFLMQSGGDLQMLTTRQAYFKTFYKGLPDTSGINFRNDNFLRAESFALPGTTLRLYPPTQATGSEEGGCGVIAFFERDSLANVIVVPSAYIPSGASAGGGLIYTVLDENGESRVCYDHPPSTYEMTFTVVDGVGGKVAHPVTVIVEAENREFGDFLWE